MAEVIENTQEPEPTTTPEVDTEPKGGKTYTEAEYKKAVEEASKETSNKIKRELSKTFGVNLFDENELNDYLEGQKNKVDKSQLDEYETKLKEAEGIKQKYEDLSFENVILKHGVKDDAQDKVKKLAKTEMNDEVGFEKAVEKVLTDFPMFKGATVRQAGANFNDDNSNLTEAERYMRENFRYDANGNLIGRKK